MAYKGTLPSELWERYDCEGGNHKLTLDLLVASDIQDRIAEATKDAKKKADGKAMAARRKQRQSKRELLSDAEGLQMLRGMGVPIVSQD
jgi:hypothetical protein